MGFVKLSEFLHMDPPHMIPEEFQGKVKHSLFGSYVKLFDSDVLEELDLDNTEVYIYQHEGYDEPWPSPSHKRTLLGRWDFREIATPAINKTWKINYDYNPKLPYTIIIQPKQVIKNVEVFINGQN